MTSNLARFIRLARHRVYGIPLRQEEQMELEQTQAIHEFKVLTATLFEFELRMELFMPAKWSYSTLGPCVEFTVDGRTFLLVQGRENCQLFCKAIKRTYCWRRSLRTENLLIVSLLHLAMFWRHPNPPI